jgi:hypothetical protein
MQMFLNLPSPDWYSVQSYDVNGQDRGLSNLVSRIKQHQVLYLRRPNQAVPRPTYRRNNAKHLGRTHTSSRLLWKKQALAPLN